MENDVTSAKTHPRISFQAVKVSSRAVGGGRGEIRRDDLDRPAAFRDDPRPASCRSARYRHTCGQPEVGVLERSRIYSIGLAHAPFGLINKISSYSSRD